MAVVYTLVAPVGDSKPPSKASLPSTLLQATLDITGVTQISPHPAKLENHSEGRFNQERGLSEGEGGDLGWSHLLGRQDALQLLRAAALLCIIRPPLPGPRLSHLREGFKSLFQVVLKLGLGRDWVGRLVHSRRQPESTLHCSVLSMYLTPGQTDLAIACGL